MVLILQDPLWRLYNLAFLHTTGIARFKVCFCRLVLRDTAATKLCSENDVRIGQFDGISSIVQFPPLHTAAVTGLCYSHLEKKMTFSAATTEDVMLGSQLIDDKKQIPQYSTYFKCLCWKLLLKKYYYYLQKEHKTAVEPHCQNDYCQLCLAGYHTINHAGD